MSSVGERESGLGGQITVLAVDVSLTEEQIEAFKSSEIAVRFERETEAVLPRESRSNADCLLVSATAFERLAVGGGSGPPVLLVCQDRNPDTVDHDAVSDFVYQADLVEQPALAARRINTVVAATQQERRATLGDVRPDPTRESASLARLFEAAPDSIIVLDETGAIIDANRTAVEKLGYSREELRSLQVDDVQVSVDATELLERCETLSVGETVTLEGEHRHADGTTHPVETLVTQIEPGNEKQFVAIARDVTERRQYENRLETQRDNLETLNQVVRHDIRNDLQLVELYADLLEDHVDEDGQDYLQKLQEGVENAVDLTTTARELAAVMLSTTVANQAVRLDSILTPQLEEIRESYPDAVVTVEDSIPSVEVVGNGMLDSVFRNLLRNAVQHNDAEAPTVGVSAQVDGDAVTVRVADNGPGVPDSRKSEIFGRGESGLDSDGTGIGLYLVESLVDSVDGDVWVEDADRSVEGTELDGATFVVEFPLA